jgi:hypothetical protein
MFCTHSLPSMPMRIAAVLFSPSTLAPGVRPQIAVIVEFSQGPRTVEVCLAVSYPFALDGRAMLCSNGVGDSPVTVTFAPVVTGPPTDTIAGLTVLAADDDGNQAEYKELIPYSSR